MCNLVCVCVCVGRLWFDGGDWEEGGREGGRDGGAHCGKGEGSRATESSVPHSLFFARRFRRQLSSSSTTSSSAPAVGAAGWSEEAPDQGTISQQTDRNPEIIGWSKKTSSRGSAALLSPQMPNDCWPEERWEESRRGDSAEWKKWTVDVPRRSEQWIQTCAYGRTPRETSGRVHLTVGAVTVQLMGSILVPAQQERSQVQLLRLHALAS